MLSMNIAKTAESIMEVKNKGQSQVYHLSYRYAQPLKKPVQAMNSTISIILAIKIIVA